MGQWQDVTLILGAFEFVDTVLFVLFPADGWELGFILPEVLGDFGHCLNITKVLFLELSIVLGMKLTY
jgi:hypothetical protein